MTSHNTPTIGVLTGAGISTGGGIPDFRGAKGVWTRDPAAAELLEIRRYRDSADVREQCWRMWRDHPSWDARPTAAHLALVELERAGVLGTVLTQNFDGLHQAAGHARRRVVELHGTLATTSCMSCRMRWDTREVLAGLAERADPHHVGCGGVLKPDVLYFGEALSNGEFDRAKRATRAASVFLAIGTSLTVQPVASLAWLAADSGAELIVVNDQPTGYDHLATRVVREPIDDAVPALVRELLVRFPGAPS